MVFEKQTILHVHYTQRQIAFVLILIFIINIQRLKEMQRLCDKINRIHNTIKKI